MLNVTSVEEYREVKDKIGVKERVSSLWSKYVTQHLAPSSVC